MVPYALNVKVFGNRLIENFGSGFDIFGLYQQLHAAQHSDKLVYRY
jgi:hypothetical protein